VPAVLVLEGDWSRPREVVEIATSAAIGCHGDDVDMGCRDTIATIELRDGTWWLHARDLEITVDDEVVHSARELRHGQRIVSTRGRGVRFLIGESERVLDELRHVDTSVDPMTRVLNRRTLLRALARRSQGALLMLDLDHLKRINDRYGMPAGNAALIRTANVLKAHVVWPDLVARYGGEEFMVLVDGTVTRARELAERIRAAAEPTFDFEGEPLTATVSIGLAEHRPPGADTIRAADEQLMHAKMQGRNRVVG